MVENCASVKCFTVELYVWANIWSQGKNTSKMWMCMSLVKAVTCFYSQNSLQRPASSLSNERESMWIVYEFYINSFPSAGSDVDVNCHWQEKNCHETDEAFWWLQRCCKQDKWDSTISKSTVLACRPKPLPAINLISIYFLSTTRAFFPHFSPSPVLLWGKQRSKSF